MVPHVIFQILNLETLGSRQGSQFSTWQNQAELISKASEPPYKTYMNECIKWMHQNEYWMHQMNACIKWINASKMNASNECIKNQLSLKIWPFAHEKYTE